jgi:hypothetical protein
LKKIITVLFLGCVLGIASSCRKDVDKNEVIGPWQFEGLKLESGTLLSPRDVLEKKGISELVLGSDGSGKEFQKEDSKAGSPFKEKDDFTWSLSQDGLIRVYPKYTLNQVVAMPDHDTLQIVYTSKRAGKTVFAVYLRSSQ